MLDIDCGTVALNHQCAANILSLYLNCIQLYQRGPTQKQEQLQCK